MIFMHEETEDSLLNAEPRIGGTLGLISPEIESLALAEMKGRGFIGPKGCLTSKGARMAKQIQREHWRD